MRAIVVLLTGVFLFLLISGYSLSVGMGDVPAVVARAPRVAINTPQFAPPGPWPAPSGDILPGGTLVAAAARATDASSGQQDDRTLGLAAPQPAFAISPAVGTPGTRVAVVGEGWEPNDQIALRLQDPGNPTAAQPEFALTTADASGNFRASFAIPAVSPWNTRPAILLWAMSSRSGIQAALPQAFVVLSAPLPPGPPAKSTSAGLVQAPGSKAAQAQTSPTATTTPGTAPTPLPSQTPEPAAGTSALQSQAATDTPEAAAGSAFQSPLPGPATVEFTDEVTETPTETPTTEGTPLGAESITDVTPTPETPEASPSPAALLTPVPATSAATTSPGLLPRAGGELLRTVAVTAAGTYLRSGPGAAYRQVEVLPRGTPLGMFSRDGTGNWLQVTAPDGTQGWVSRADTDLR